MKIQDQVASLELSKQLKELGVQQPGAMFYHILHDIGAYLVFTGGEWIEVMDHYPYVAAFTVAELGQMLPLNNCFPNIGKSELGDWFVNFNRNHQEHFSTEADARAKMLIWLAQNNLINPKTIKL